jgi:hypothetical protein
MISFLILLSSISHPTPYPTLGPDPNPTPTLFPIHLLDCNKLNKIDCTNSYVCGWCHNTTSCLDDDDSDDFWNNSTNNNSTDNGRCIEIGYCGIGTKINNCPFLITSGSCFIVKMCLFAFFMVVTINLVYCVIRGIHIPLLKSNYSTSCKQFTIFTIYCTILVPTIYFYFNNFSIFIYLMTGSALAGILFWICYGSSNVIRIVNNRHLQNNSNQEASINSETDRLLRN